MWLVRPRSADILGSIGRRMITTKFNNLSACKQRRSVKRGSENAGCPMFVTLVRIDMKMAKLLITHCGFFRS